jgi:hypothetical protein
MEILSDYNFQRPSRSRYAPVVEALIEKGIFAVKLKRGEDFPSDANINSVQGAISTQIRESPKNTTNRRARTWVEDPETANVLIVSLYPEGEGPAARSKTAKKKPARQPAVA